MTVQEFIEELQHYNEDKKIQILVKNNEGEYEECYLDFIYQTEENVCIEII